VPVPAERKATTVVTGKAEVEKKATTKRMEVEKKATTKRMEVEKKATGRKTKRASPGRRDRSPTPG
jgi:hypothetical protein